MAASTPRPRSARGSAATRVSTPPDSYARLFRAAVAEFSERGYDGARVDRIAEEARINKAMLYYHFTSKQGLYQEVIREMVRAVGARVRAIADGPGTAQERLDAWVDAVVEEAAARPWFPPIMLHELAAGAPHLDADTFALMNGIHLAVRDILVEGQRCREFRDVDPLLTYFTIMPPILMFFARERVRVRAKTHTPLIARRSRQQFVTHMQASIRGMLRKDG